MFVKSVNKNLIVLYLNSMANRNLLSILFMLVIIWNIICFDAAYSFSLGGQRVVAQAAKTEMANPAKPEDTSINNHKSQNKTELNNPETHSDKGKNIDKGLTACTPDENGKVAPWCLNKSITKYVDNLDKQVRPCRISDKMLKKCSVKPNGCSLLVSKLTEYYDVADGRPLSAPSIEGVDDRGRLCKFRGGVTCYVDYSLNGNRGICSSATELNRKAIKSANNNLESSDSYHSGFREVAYYPENDLLDKDGKYWSDIGMTNESYDYTLHKQASYEMEEDNSNSIEKLEVLKKEYHKTPSKSQFQPITARSPEAERIAREDTRFAFVKPNHNQFFHKEVNYQDSHLQGYAQGDKYIVFN